MSGINPVKELCPNDTFFKAVISIIEIGKEPARLVVVKSIICKFFINPIREGIVPVKSFSLNFKDIKLVSNVIYSGIVLFK